MIVVAPDPEWPAKFAAESAILAQVLVGVSHELHHIGSTAIGGIFAKPIIDVLLLVDDLTALDARAPAFEQIGYEVKGEHGIAGRRYFRKLVRCGNSHAKTPVATAIPADGPETIRSGHDRTEAAGALPQLRRECHLHAYLRGSHHGYRHLAFRDYMKAHPAIAAEYSALKRALAEVHPNDRRAYVSGKDAYVSQHELAALAWRKAAEWGVPTT